MEKERINEISNEINELIKLQVSKIQSDELISENYKEHYLGTIVSLEREISETEEVLKDFKEENLTFNAIELEGYLRALKTILSMFRDDEKYLQNA